MRNARGLAVIRYLYLYIYICICMCIYIHRSENRSPQMVAICKGLYDNSIHGSCAIYFPSGIQT